MGLSGRCLQIERQGEEDDTRVVSDLVSMTLVSCVCLVCVCQKNWRNTPELLHSWWWRWWSSVRMGGWAHPRRQLLHTVRALTSPVRGGRGTSHAQAPHALLSAPTTIHIRVYSCSPRCVCTRAWSLRGYPLASLHMRAPPHTHTSSPETYLSPPMSSRLNVSHGITSTSASLQGPEGQRQRDQQVLW